MSIRHYCDVCAEPVTRNYVSKRIRGTVVIGDASVLVEIMVGYRTWNAGDLCKECLHRVVEIAIAEKLSEGVAVAASESEAMR